ncbi:hypothetical protein B0H14DRAFT_2622039 [Mycena olivaceomarginata]|nr:hypothetical protein B0H14DRAFT_2622039 [Mycena olivaceomarginata]
MPDRTLGGWLASQYRHGLRTLPLIGYKARQYSAAIKAQFSRMAMTVYGPLGLALDAIWQKAGKSHLPQVQLPFATGQRPHRTSTDIDEGIHEQADIIRRKQSSILQKIRNKENHHDLLNVSDYSLAFGRLCLGPDIGAPGLCAGLRRRGCNPGGQAQCALCVSSWWMDRQCLCANTSFAPSVIQCAGQTSCSPELQTQISDIIQQMCALASGSASASGASTSGTGTVSVSVSSPGGSTVSPSGSGSVTIVPPPISHSSSTPPPSTSSGSASASVTAPTSTSSAAPSTSPSTSTAHRTQMGGAGVVGALFVVAVGIIRKSLLWQCPDIASKLDQIRPNFFDFLDYLPSNRPI